MIKHLAATAAIFTLVASPAVGFAQSTLLDSVITTVQRASAETPDEDAARASRKAYNERAQIEMIEQAERGNAKAASGELPPTKAVPYWHTRQMCTGKGGKKAPCRIYR
jgi:hypothetical protein